MKLTFLVPSAEYRASAGARIRYGRLTEGLAKVGVAVSLTVIGAFDPRTADCDVLVISKCHDARSILAAAEVSARGKLVGVDLFDDYFSQHCDARLQSYRTWLSDVLRECHFCLCSTKALAEVVQSYRPGIPTHVVNDPAPEHQPARAAAAADAKAAEAKRTGNIRAIWFGVGDNPYFEVGLADLFAHAQSLRSLAAEGQKVELSIVTNRRALDAEGLELISRLPVASRVVEWSEKSERDVLNEALVAFLPVAEQSFSAAKSLNRAFTALAHGCQILTAGHPLYATLEPLIYSEPAELVADLGCSQLKLSAATLPLYEERLRQFADAEVEAEALCKFLDVLEAPGPKTAARLCVIHGLGTRSEVHQLAKALQALSVASPVSSAVLDFDAVFRDAPPRMTMLTEKAASRPRRRRKPADEMRFAYQLTTYGAALADMEQQLEEQFGPVRLILSETSRVPVPVPEAPNE